MPHLTDTTIEDRRVSVRRLSAIHDVIVTDFPFRDLAPATSDATDRAVEVLAASEASPDRGEELRSLTHPFTGEHLLSTFEGETGLQWHVDHLGEFWIDPTGWHIRYRLLPGAPIADAESLLLGPILGLAAQQRGRTILHAATILVDGVAAAFSAPHGLGKSTLAQSFAADGIPLLSDDMLPVTFEGEEPWAAPYVPRAKLRDDSIRHLRGDTLGDALDAERAVSWWDKRRIEVGNGWGEPAQGPAPLRALYLLTPSLDPNTTIEITPLAVPEAALALQGAMYSPQTLQGARSIRALDAGLRLAASIRVARVHYHRSYEGLAALKACLVEDALHAPERAKAHAS